MNMGLDSSICSHLVIHSKKSFKSNVTKIGDYSPLKEFCAFEIHPPVEVIRFYFCHGRYDYEVVIMIPRHFLCSVSVESWFATKKASWEEWE
jgi:hypothetical protein